MHRPPPSRGAAIGLILAFATVGAIPGTATPAGAREDLNITISRDTVARLITASVPYEMRMDVGLFEQVVTLTNPRDIRLVPGGIRLRMTATGAPLPFQADIDPFVRLVRDAATGGYTIKVDRMPVNMGRAGTYDLASYIKPIPVEKVSSHLLATPSKEIALDLVVDRIEVAESGIVVRFLAEFR